MVVLPAFPLAFAFVCFIRKFRRVGIFSYNVIIETYITSGAPKQSSWILLGCGEVVLPFRAVGPPESNLHPGKLGKACSRR